MAVGTAVWRQLGIAVARMGWHGVVPVAFVEQRLLGLFRHRVLLVTMFRVGDPGKAMLGTADGMLDSLTSLSTFGYLGYWSLAGFEDVTSSLSDRFALLW